MWTAGFNLCLLGLYALILTFFTPMLPSYRNQSIDLHCKPTDWFLDEENIGMEKVNKIPLPWLLQFSFSKIFLSLFYSAKTSLVGVDQLLLIHTHCRSIHKVNQNVQEK